MKIALRIALAAGCLVGTALTGTGLSAAERPNVVFILCDDLGYGDLGCFGAPDIQTPRLDALAKRGVRLTDCYSNGPVCTPTRAAFITGRYQQRTGLEWAIGPGLKEPGLPAFEGSLASVLKRQGYATALVGKWHLGYRPEFSPLRHGFDEFFGIKSGNVDHYSHREINNEADLYEGDEPIERDGYLTDLLVDRAVSFVERKRDAPFFLYLAFNTVHWPFQAPGRPGDVRNRENWFDGSREDYVKMVEAMDAAIGRVIDAVDRLDDNDNTLIIFTSDNGGERLSFMGGLAKSKGTLWEGGIRVPGIVSWPKRLPAGKTSDLPTATFDFTASIVAAAGVDLAGQSLEGRDAMPLLAGERDADERSLFWRIEREGRSQRAVRRGDWKYLRDGDREHLFQLSHDPGERHDLAAAEPERLAMLRGQVADWERDVDRIESPFRVR